MNDKIKRYGISIAFVIFIASCIGIFYIQASDNAYPDFKLMKQQGDENEAKDVFLRGMYEQIRFNPYVTIGLEGSQYSSEQSFLERIDPHYNSHEEVKKLVKEHRQFMRGRRADYSFYHNDQWLVSADVNWDYMSSGRPETRHFYLDVVVLDKKKNHSWSFEVSLPDSQEHQFIVVHDVQVHGDEIIVVTQNHNSGKFHRYTLSLQSENEPKLTDQMIEIPPLDISGVENSSEHMNYNLQIINNSNIIQPNRYQVFFATQTQNAALNEKAAAAEEVNRHQAQPKEIVSAQFMIYDLQTEELMEINAQEIIDFLDIPLAVGSINTKLEGDHLFLTKNGSQGVNVLEYSIPDGNATSYEVQLDSVTYSEVKDHRIYMLSKDNKDSSGQPLLSIADLVSGEIVYQGTIEVKGSERNETEELNRLRISHIFIK